MHTGTASLIDMCAAENAARRMRLIRPAYRKIRKTISSCRTVEQLTSAYRMVENFHDRFSYAQNFSVELYKAVFDHQYGDDVMQLIQDGKA